MSNYIRFYNNEYNLIFITMVTNNRLPILINNIETLRASFKYAKQKHSFEIFACVILKDHIHMILNIEKDDTRTKYIESKGYKVIRFWNNDINENIDGVYQKLNEIL